MNPSGNSKLECDNCRKAARAGRIVSRIILIFIFIGSLCWIAAIKFFYGPAKMRAAFTQDSKKYWQGEISVGGCEYFFSQPQCRWTDIDVLDADSRKWAAAEKMELSRDGGVAGINLTGLIADIPLEKLRNHSRYFSFSGLEPLSRENFTALDISANKTDLAVSWPVGKNASDSNSSARNIISVNFAESLGVNINWPQWSDAPIWFLADNGLKTSAMGRFDTNNNSFHVNSASLETLGLKYTGNYSGSEAVELQLNDIRLENIGIWPDAAQCELARFSLPDGGKAVFSGSVHPASKNYECSLSVQNIDLALLSDFISEGTISGNCESAEISLSRVTGNNTAAAGKIVAAFSDVRIGSIGVMGRVLSLLAMTSAGGANLYDIKCELDIDYPQVQVISCRLNSSVHNIAIQSGSFNLDDSTMDIYLTLDLLEGGSGLIGSLKNAVGRIIRVHVTGSFDDPKTEFITTPIELPSVIQKSTITTSNTESVQKKTE